MSANAEIRAAIKQIMLDNEELYSVVGKVSNINETKRTCDVAPISENAKILEVRLQASISSEEGFVNIPKDGSLVIVTFLSKESAFVSLCTEIDKVFIDTPMVVFNGGDNGGLIIIAKLVSAFNAFVKVFNSHFHTTTATISASPVVGVIAPPASGASETSVSDLEDDKVKH